jgi:hypothetical protein
MTHPTDYNKLANKNRGRITSDNYNVILYFINDTTPFPAGGIDLGELYGLTEFGWEASDELIVRKPCTRVEPMGMLKMNGFNLDFSFIREEIPDNDTKGHITNLLLAQYQMYLNSYSSTDRTVNAATVAQGTYKYLGENFYTEDGKEANDTVSRFGEPLRHLYVPLRVDIEVQIKDFSLNKVDSYDSLRFSNVLLYGPTEKVEQNSSFISNSFKGFAPHAERGKPPFKKADDFYAFAADENIMTQLSTSKGLSNFLRRVIINPSNEDINE